MRPRNKVEREVMALHARLPRLSESQKEWMRTRLLTNYAYRNQSKAWCSECGNHFSLNDVKEKNGIISCPHCNAKLKIHESKKRAFDTDEWFVILTTIKGWQVLRYFYVQKHSRKYKESYFVTTECLQYWYRPDGRKVILEKRKTFYNWYQRIPYSFDSELTIKDKRNATPNYVNIAYPRKRILPMYKKMGINCTIEGMPPHHFFDHISNPRFETIIKTHDASLIKYAFENPSTIDSDLWNSLKVSFRRKYKIDDYPSYFDYLTLAKRLKVDIRNPKYACPDDLIKAHEKMLDKEERLNDKIRWQRNLEYEPTYRARIRKFFDMEIRDDLFKIVPLKSIKEFRHEGHVLHHCVYKMDYFKKESSLILSARIGDESIETIEVSLKSFTILQCHGMRDNRSEYHDRILELVNKNMDVIKSYNRKRGTKIKKTSAQIAVAV